MSTQKDKVRAALVELAQKGQRETNFDDFLEEFEAKGKNRLGLGGAKNPRATLSRLFGELVVEGVVAKTAKGGHFTIASVAAAAPAKPKPAKAAKPKPAKATKPKPTAAAAHAGKKRTRSRKPKTDSFKSYSFKVLKQVHPDTGASSRAVETMDNFTQDMLERIVAQAHQLAKANGQKTITAREVQTAVRLLLPGELAKHAVSEGTRAVTKFRAD